MLCIILSSGLIAIHQNYLTNFYDSDAK
jgi:hypothetical protein